MNKKGVIRKGDITSHGGIVLEGLENHLIYHKPIACKGHMTSCPLCGGNYPIIEGVVSYAIKGRKVAVEGMKTECGAILIASKKDLKIG